MSQPDRTNITIHFDNVNICFGTQITGEQSQSGKALQELKIAPFFSPGVPMPGATLPVRPSTTSALGTICASVTYPGPPLPDEVRAFVYPLEYFPSPPPVTPPTLAVTGTPTNVGSGVVWAWNSSNYVLGANYSTAGNSNKLVIWRRDGTTWTCDGAVLFTGVTGTMGPCGSGSGSGSGSAPSHSAKTFPAIWCAVIRGFNGTLLASFNASWALRQVAKATVPTWDNGGDDGGAVKVTLTLDKQSAWHLTLTVQQIRIAYTLPLQGHAFGPLKFPGRQENVAHVGQVALPAIEVFAM